MDSYDASNDADLSISELSIIVKPEPEQPFSLLARPRPLRNPVQTTPPPSEDPNPGEPSQSTNHETDAKAIEEESDHVESPQEDDNARKQSVSRQRDERLKQDLFVLRKLNDAFGVFNDALEETRSSKSHVAEQLEETNALLNKYIDILAKQEEATRLIFDERWRGAEEDEHTLTRLRQQAEEKAKREAQERALALQREREAKEKEERDRLAREERERIEAEKKERLAIRAGYGSVRGVRGTRASMRGAVAARAAAGRGSGIPSASSTRGRPSPNASGNTSGGKIPRPASSASGRSIASTASTRSGVK